MFSNSATKNVNLILCVDSRFLFLSSTLEGGAKNQNKQRWPPAVLLSEVFFVVVDVHVSKTRT